MINEHVENLMLNQDDALVLSADKVATVRKENTLLHALMLLQNVGYASIPVVDNNQKLQGVLRMPDIIRGVQDSLDYNWNLLSEKKVGDVMSVNHSVVVGTPDLEDILHSLVDHNYVNVVNEEGIFQGIITRKTILTRMNFMAHAIDQYFDIEVKEELFTRVQ